MPRAPIWSPLIASPRHRDTPISFLCTEEDSTRAVILAPIAFLFGLWVPHPSVSRVRFFSWFCRCSQSPANVTLGGRLLSSRANIVTERSLRSFRYIARCSSGRGRRSCGRDLRLCRSATLRVLRASGIRFQARSDKRRISPDLSAAFVAQGARRSWRGPGDFSFAGAPPLINRSGRGAISIPDCAELFALISFSFQL